MIENLKKTQKRNIFNQKQKTIIKKNKKKKMKNKINFSK